MGASQRYQYSRWCLVVGTVVVFAAVMGAVIPGMTAEQNLKRRATAVVLPTTTLSPVVALLSGKYTTTTAAAVITSDPQSTMPAAEGPTAAHILQTPTGKIRVDGNIIKKGKDSEARESTPNEKFDPEGEICNAKLAKPAIEPSRRWELDPSWMTLCHVNDHEHSFPNLERNWCWVGFKTQCHQTGKGHDQSWAAVQDFAYKAGRVPPPDQAPFAPLQNHALCDRPSLGVPRNWTDDELAKARTWFRKYVRVYIVNLQADAKSLTKIARRLRELSIDFTRVGGMDMTNADTMEQAVIAGWISKDFNFSRALVAARKVAVDGGQNLLPGIHSTIGRAATHFRAQSRVVDDGATLGLILEDDAWLESDFVPRLWSVVSSELPCDWEVLSLSSRCGYGRCVSPHLTRVQPDGNEKGDTCRHGVNLGMLGTLYRARAVGPLQARWQRVVFDDSRPYCFGVDVALASMSDSVAYYAVPSSQAPGFLHELEQGHTS